MDNTTPEQWQIIHAFLAEAETLAPIANFEWMQAQVQAEIIAQSNPNPRFISLAFWHCAAENGGGLPDALAMTDRMKRFSAKYTRLSAPDPETALRAKRDAEIYLGQVPADATPEEREIAAKRKEYVDGVKAAYPPRTAYAFLTLELKRMMFR